MDEKHPMLRWWPIVVAVSVGLIGYGKLQGDVATLKERVAQLEDRVDPLRSMRVGKGDLCMQLLKAWEGTKDQDRAEMLVKRWQEAECEAVPAFSTAEPAKDAVNLVSGL